MRFVFFLWLLLPSFIASSQLKLSRLVSDGMVLQRNTHVPLWGWAAPGEAVTLRFQQKEYKTIADGAGKWQLQLEPQSAGGPHQMVFTGSNTITVNDVLFGDVWLCSGQSNMELTMERVRYKYADVVEKANNNAIRQFEVPDRYQFTGAEADLPSGKWLPATKENILKFSAVAYFFADDLYRTYGVPIGLVNAALGGSPAEAWISESALKNFPVPYAEAQKFKDSNLIQQIESADRNAQQNWHNQLAEKDLGIKNKWAAPPLDEKDWMDIDLPRFWSEAALGKVNGSVWFRKNIQLTEEQSKQPAEILLGRIVDADSVFINGHFVGTTSYQYPPRRYKVPAGILTSGNNVIAVKVINQSGNGGFVRDKPYQLQVGPDVIDLKGTWKYKLGAASEPAPSSTTIRWKPTGLFNAMIAPLTNYPIKGIIWYQGESNTGNPSQYKALMQTLITDWRMRWKQKDLPFLFVQLANFMEPQAAPAESQWAQLRQAQLQTLETPHTGMVVAIDLGEWNDIHPLNKLDIGRRLALQAKHLAYGDNKIVHSGPRLQSVIKNGNKLVILFTNTGGGLTTNDKRDLKHFAIAGGDKKFLWADAKIEGDKVIVWSDKIKSPAYVRYAWADNPEGANLYNKAGLPASPFEAAVK